MIRQADRARRRRSLALARLESLESRQLLATLVVTSAADSGAGTLRQAITEVNSGTSSATIDFEIPGSGVQTIALQSALPEIINPTVIDATTEPGYAGTPLVELDGAGILNTTVSPPVPLAGVDGLVLMGGLSTVKGLAIDRFTGVGILATLDDNTISANFIGTDPTGRIARSNGGDGVILSGRDDTVGGNLISGNLGAGVALTSNGSLPSDDVVEGNEIGVDATGAGDLGNALAGIDVESSDNLIGGSTPADRNMIGFNGGPGVEVGSYEYLSGVIGNRITNNRIFSNVGLGIDLGNDGVTPNGAGDGNYGPNELQNDPLLTSAYPSTTDGLTVEGTLTGTPGSAYTVEFYASTQADPSGYGQGQTPIGSEIVEANSSGLVDVTSTVTAPPVGEGFLTATATDSAGNTSEFSKAIPVMPTAEVGVSVTASPVFGAQAGAPSTYFFTVTNTGPSKATNVVFSDVLPAGAEDVSGTVGQGSIITTPSVLMANIGTLADGASTTVAVTLTLPLPGSATNTVGVTTNQTNTSTMTTVTQQIPISQAAPVDLSIYGYSTPESVQVSQELTFTFVVQNNSNTEGTGVDFADPLPAGLVPISATSSQGVTAISGQDVGAQLGTLPGGANATITVVVTPVTPGPVSNFATVKGNEPDDNSLDNSTTVDAYINPAPTVVLATVIQQAPITATVGQTLEDNVLVGNTGTANATGVTVTDVLPVAATVVSILPSQGTYTLVGNVLTVNFDTLAVGAVASVTIGLIPGAPGVITDRASVVAAEAMPDISNDFAQVDTAVVAPATGPTVLNQNLIVSGNRITGVVLTFDEDMNPNSASMIANYEVLDLNQNGSLTATGPKVTISSAKYNKVTRSVTLDFKSGLNLGKFYKVIANGSGAPGLVDTAGNVLDGEANGLQNSIYQSVIGRGTTKRPVALQVGVPKPKPTPVQKASVVKHKH